MLTHVTLRTSRFNLTEGKDYFVNPGCFGDDFVKWLIVEFAKCDLLSELDPEPCAEDWGWEVLLSYHGRAFFIGLNAYSEAGNDGWLLFVESRLPFYKRWLGVSDSEENRELCSLLDGILKSAPEIEDIRWYSKEDFMKGIEDRWQSSPNGDA